MLQTSDAVTQSICNGVWSKIILIFAGKKRLSLNIHLINS